MIQYQRSPPQLSIDGLPLIGGPLYSGNGDGLNNTALEAEPDVGPIPAGAWQIVEWAAHYEDKGPNVAILAPVGHDACGRSGFLIHGDNSAGNFSASHGCIIAGPSLRDALHASGEIELEVI